MNIARSVPTVSLHMHHYSHQEETGRPLSLDLAAAKESFLVHLHLGEPARL